MEITTKPFFFFFLHTWLYLLMTPALIMLVIPGLPSYNGVEVYYLKGVIGLPIVISFSWQVIYTYFFGGKWAHWWRHRHRLDRFRFQNFQSPGLHIVRRSLFCFGTVWIRFDLISSLLWIYLLIIPYKSITGIILGILCYFWTKTYYMGTQLNYVGEAISLNIHKICFDTKIRYILTKWSLTVLYTYSADDKLIIIFLFFLENRIWHIMQIVSSGDNLHEVSNFIF